MEGTRTEGRKKKRQLTNSVRDLGFAALMACGGLKDQVCTRCERNPWLESKGKSPTRKENPAEACAATRTATTHTTKMHRCGQHNTLLTLENRGHHVLLEDAQLTCIIGAQTKPWTN